MQEHDCNKRGVRGGVGAERVNFGFFFEFQTEKFQIQRLNVSIRNRDGVSSSPRTIYFQPAPAGYSER